MATITAQMVKGLRDKTDLPMMECKHALAECNGDIEAAVDWLRKKHKGKLAERAGRTTGEGRIAVYINEARTVGAVIELQCETAQVGQNKMFTTLADTFARKVADGSCREPGPDEIRRDPQMDTRFTDVFGRLREAMNLTKCRRMEGAYLTSYIHHDGKSGVLLALDAAPVSDKNIGADLCMHTLFSMPIAVDRDGVSGELVDKVSNEAREMAVAEDKPPQIIDKIVEGKVNAFFQERVLLEQLHVKTDDYGKKKIRDILKEAGATTVTDLAIMKIGG